MHSLPIHFAPYCNFPNEKEVEKQGLDRILAMEIMESAKQSVPAQ